MPLRFAEAAFDDRQEAELPMLIGARSEARQSRNSSPVGWVERTDTHQCR
jgi:hypothetical protein